MFGNLTLNVICGWRGGARVCLYFEDAEHYHTIPGLDVNVLMLGRGREEQAARC